MSNNTLEPKPSNHTGNGILPQPSENFVDTDRVTAITDRALSYLRVGYPVHFAGPAGTGKTTLAFHVAAQLGRPVSLIHGNHEFGAGDLVGKDSGYRRSSVIDNYVSSVLKTQEDVSVKWTNNRLTVACEQGHTLIYDEFNRTTAEANNTLLSILEEGILNVPRAGGGYVRVHPDFRVIFTSNPDEYAGVHRTQDALLDRMVTMNVDHYDAETEIEITSHKGQVDEHTAAFIVEIARQLRTINGGARPTIRSCIAMGQIVSDRELELGEPLFHDFAWDIFGPDAVNIEGVGPGADRSDFKAFLDNIAKRILGSAPLSIPEGSPADGRIRPVIDSETASQAQDPSPAKSRKRASRRAA